MGIQGLLPFLNEASMAINISELTNCVALVDVYCWLHKGVYGCSDDLYNKKDTSVYVDYCINKVDSLKKIGIKCILVFDGANLPSKKHTEEARRRYREKTKERIKELILEGNTREASELMKRCVDITPEMAKKLIIACRKNKIDYIVAPYEADAQIAYLMRKKIGHFVITEDSDLLLFECDFILVKLDRYGKGILIRRSKISDCLGPKAANFTYEKFRRMCILSGCDYLPNLPGIGLQKAKKFFGLTMNDDIKKTLPKVPSYLKMKGLKVDQEYIEGFLRAENTFKYQLVFCPMQRKLVPLTPYDETVNVNQLDYAGEMIDNDLALQWALGNVDIRTKKVVDHWLPLNFHSSPNARDDSIWSCNFKPRDYNPLEVRFGVTKIPNSDSGDKEIFQSSTQTSFSSQSSSLSIKRSSNEPSPFSKRLSIDTSLIESYKKSTISSPNGIERQIESDELQVVKSRHFFTQHNDESITTKTLDELLEEREKKRKRLSFLCSLDNVKFPEDLTNTSIKATESIESTPPSSQPSSLSQISSTASQSSSQSSHFSQSSAQSCSPSFSTAIELAEPILSDTPPSDEKKPEVKVIRSSISLLERFAFKKRPLTKL